MKNYTHYRRQTLLSGKSLASVFFLLIAWLVFAWNTGDAWAHGKASASPDKAEVEASAPAGPATHHHKDQPAAKLGATVYKHMCVFCHGIDGDGGGKATSYLYPWPRDFRKGIFKNRSTPSGSLPLDKDIFETIENGIPGTAMPGWGVSLSEDEIWAVIEYIKKFSDRFANESRKAPVPLHNLPGTKGGSVENGKIIFGEMRCVRCHGTDLKGQGPIADKLFDIWDHRVFVYDLTNPNTYKWGFEQRDIYKTLTTGIDGTPMKSYSHLTSEERWDLAAFVESKINIASLQKAEFEIDLHPVKSDKDLLDIGPESPLWDDVAASEVRLVPLNARRNPINRIKFQSLINDEAIAIRVEWDDKTANRSSSRHQDFKDAVAIEFALGDVLLHTHGHNEPFFGMGNRGKPVNIWQWRADWQTEIETKKKLEYATKGMDMDVMIFGGEVNPVESLNPFRDVPVEELNAEGFGTLTPQPNTKQNVRGKGVWKDGKWQVVFYRTLKSMNRWDIKFSKEKPALIAFAVWDGEEQDRNGRKVVSMWQRLNLP